MDYNQFKRTMSQGIKLVSVGSSEEEIKRFLLSREFNVTDAVVEDFMRRAKEVK